MTNVLYRVNTDEGILAGLIQPCIGATHAYRINGHHLGSFHTPSEAIAAVFADAAWWAGEQVMV